MPLALLAVGSELDPEKYEVVIIDGRLEADAASAVLAQLEGALCFGVTVLTGAPIADAINLSRAVKAARPQLPVVWGGWHPSMFARECLEEASVDVIVRGQGEATFAEIVRRLSAGESLADCPGSTVRLPDGSVQENAARPLLPVEMFRAHDYSLIPVERYFDLKGKRQLDFIPSQGCNFRCAFCSDPFVYQRKWVGIEPGSMVERLHALWQRTADDVNFQTTFFAAAGLQAFVDRPIGDLKFTRAGTMRRIRACGCRMSGSARCNRPAALVGVESDPMKCSHPQGHPHRAGVPDRAQDGRAASPGLSFIVGTPRSDDSIRDRDCANACAPSGQSKRRFH
jgi:hypothetical protein